MTVARWEGRRLVAHGGLADGYEMGRVEEIVAPWPKKALDEARDCGLYLQPGDRLYMAKQVGAHGWRRYFTTEHQAMEWLKKLCTVGGSKRKAIGGPPKRRRKKVAR